MHLSEGPDPATEELLDSPTRSSASAPTAETSAPASLPPADPWLFRPASWFEPLDLRAMFDRPAPLEVELGSGDGSFLVSWARLNPDRNFIGVERLLGRVRKIGRKARRANVTNIRSLRIEASYCLEYLLPRGGVAALHIYFPDPWPKRRHHKNRLINEAFPALAHRVLSPDGVVHLRTDNVEYFERMQEVFRASPLFAPTEPPERLVTVVTDFETEFNLQGIPTRRASYRRLEPQP